MYNPVPIPVGPGGFRGGGGGGSSAAVAAAPAESEPEPEPEEEITATTTPYIPSAGDVVLNELSFVGTETNGSDEWVELYNKTGNSISLSGWTLHADDGAPYIPLSGSIAAGGYYLIERKNTGETNEATESPIADITADLWTSFGTGLEDGGEHLYLSYFSGTATTTIDELNFTCTFWCSLGGGSFYFSLERRSPTLSGLTESDWTANRGDRTNFKNGTDQGGIPLRATPKARNYANYLANYGSDLTTGTLTLTEAGGPYLIDSVWFTISAGATLTVEPGTTIKFLNNAGIQVNGTLTANGTTNNNITFTSYRDDTYGGDFNLDASATSPSAGDWYGIEYNAGSGGSISYANIRYGGRYVGQGDFKKSNIYVNNASPTISNNTIEYSKVYGLFLQNASSTVSNNTIRYQTAETPSYGIYGGGGAPTISTNTITDNYIGMSFDTTNATISSNTFTNNTGGAFSFNGNLLADGRIQNNTGTNNGAYNGIRLPSGDLMSANISSTFSKNTLFPYIINNTLSVPTTATLITEAGSVWKFGNFPLNISGTIDTNGTADNPVLFTSLWDDSDGNDVHSTGSTTPLLLQNSGIYMQPNSISDFLNSTIRYMHIGLSYDASPISLENILLEHNDTGLSAPSDTTITKAINVTFTSNNATSTIQLQ